MSDQDVSSTPTQAPTADATPPPGTLNPDAIGGLKGMAGDPSTLASTGLLLAVLMAVVAGFLNIIEDAGGDLQARLLALTGTIDSGDVALAGIAVALLLVTPDPPGGIPRSLLLQLAAVLSGVMAVFEVIRAVVVGSEAEVTVVTRISGILATLGVAAASATISFYAARVSLHKEREDEEQAAA